jgi:hypothetical protein
LTEHCGSLLEKRFCIQSRVPYSTLYSVQVIGKVNEDELAALRNEFFVKNTSSFIHYLKNRHILKMNLDYIICEVIMGITIVWDNNENSVMRITFGKTWTWEEVDSIVEATKVMMDQVNHQVDQIIDMKNIGGIPEGAFWRLRKITQTRHHNQGRVIMVGGNAFVRATMDTLRRIVSDLFEAETFVLVPTVEEARAQLFKKRLEMASGF